MTSNRSGHGVRWAKVSLAPPGALAELGALAGEVGDKMGMILKISPESGFLHVGATGTFSLVEAKRTFTEMLEAVAQNKIGKVLFDGRGLAGNPRVMERLYYGVFAAQTVATLAAGESQTLRFPLGPDELRYWNAATRDWVIDTTTIDVFVGGDSTAAQPVNFTIVS